MKNDKAKVYSDVLETSALNQFNSIVDQKFVDYGVLLPNAYTGNTIPVGSVFVTNDRAHEEWIKKSSGTLIVKTNLSKKIVKINSLMIMNLLSGVIRDGFLEVSYGTRNHIWLIIRSRGDYKLRMAILSIILNKLNGYKKSGIEVKYVLDRQDTSITDMGKKFIHRLGVISSFEGEAGFLLGNIRDGTFLTVGKGFKDSLSSSACFSGRIMKSTKSTILMDNQVIENSLKGVEVQMDSGTLNKLPYIYKNPFHVMEQQKMMVEQVNWLRPLIHNNW